MPTALTDTRTINRLDPDQLMEQIAGGEIIIAKAKARYEARVKAIKDAYEEEVACTRLALETAQQQLAAWIDANRLSFTRPRSRSNAYGKYGLRQVSNLRIPDQEALEAAIKERELEDCRKTVVSLVKPAITKRLREGEAIPGAELEVGEIAFCEVHKALVDNALAED